MQGDIEHFLEFCLHSLLFSLLIKTNNINKVESITMCVDRI